MLCQGPAALLLCLGPALLPRHQGYGNSSLYGVQSSVTMSILLSLGDQAACCLGTGDRHQGQAQENLKLVILGLCCLKLYCFAGSAFIGGEVGQEDF